MSTETGIDADAGRSRGAAWSAGIIGAGGLLAAAVGSIGVEWVVWASRIMLLANLGSLLALGIGWYLWDGGQLREWVLWRLGISQRRARATLDAVYGRRS